MHQKTKERNHFKLHLNKAIEIESYFLQGQAQHTSKYTYLDAPLPLEVDLFVGDMVVHLFLLQCHATYLLLHVQRVGSLLLQDLNRTSNFLKLTTFTNVVHQGGLKITSLCSRMIN